MEKHTVHIQSDAYGYSYQQHDLIRQLANETELSEWELMKEISDRKKQVPYLERQYGTFERLAQDCVRECQARKKYSIMEEEMDGDYSNTSNNSDYGEQWDYD